MSNDCSSNDMVENFNNSFNSAAPLPVQKTKYEFEPDLSGFQATCSQLAASDCKGLALFFNEEKS